VIALVLALPMAVLPDALGMASVSLS